MLADLSGELDTVVFLSSEMRDASVLKVAGLPLFLRNMRILKRSGISRITLVGTDPDSRLDGWASASGIVLQRCPVWRPTGRRTLLLAAHLAFQREFITRFLALCLTPDASAPAFRLRYAADCACSSGPGVMLVEGAVDGSFGDVGEVWARFSGRENPSPEPVTVGAACRPIRDGADSRQFYRAIEKTMIKPTDGLFARWNRRISLPLSRALVATPVTPNGISYFTLLVAALAAFLLARGEYQPMLVGGMLVQIASILDGNDGELARLKIIDSDYGTWLDTVCDYVAYFLTFGGIGLGLYRSTRSSLYLVMTLLMFAGFVAAMLLTSRLRKRYTGTRGAGALTSVVIDSLEGHRGKDRLAGLSHRLRHFGTRATFSYCVMLLGILDAWQVVFWAAAIGAQIFWMAVLYNERIIRAATR